MLRELLDRVDRLEKRREPRHYATANRPDAADAPGAVIFNTDTSTHQGSDGTSWNDLY